MSKDKQPVETTVGQAVEQTAEAKKKKAPNRRLRYGGMAIAVTLLVVAGAVILSALADVLYARFPARIDVTSDNVYAVSEQTEEVIDAIDQPVEIVAFFPELVVSNPSIGDEQLNTIYKQVYEVWQQYSSRSGGKVSVKYVDLANYPTESTQYSTYGEVVQGSVLVRSGSGENERYRLRSLSDFFSYASDYYNYTYTSKVEQTTASLINAVLSDIDEEVMMLTGHGEDTQTVTLLTELYQANGYTVSQINLASAQVIGENVTTAIIAAPTADLSEAETTRLRDWLTNDGKLGRNLMVVVNTMVPKATCPNLYEFLDDGYGIEVTDNLVWESDAGRQLAGSSGQVIYADMPESPVQKGGDLPTSVLAMLPRQILLKAGTDTEKTLFNIPLVTFPESSRLIDLNKADAAEVTADEYPVVGMGMSVKWTYDNSGDESVGVQTNVVVCDQGIVDGLALRVPGMKNEAILLDIMNYISGGEEAQTIPSQDLTPDYLQFSEGDADAWHIVFAYVLPLGLVVAGLVVFLRRRHL